MSQVHDVRHEIEEPCRAALDHAQLSLHDLPVLSLQQGADKSRDALEGLRSSCDSMPMSADFFSWVSRSSETSDKSWPIAMMRAKAPSLDFDTKLIASWRIFCVGAPSASTTLMAISTRLEELPV